MQALRSPWQRAPSGRPGGTPLESGFATMGLVGFLVDLARLATGILAISDPAFPLQPPRAFHFAEAALLAAQARGVDPWELVAVARNESSFRVNNVGPDGKDCGITQTRVTGSRYSCGALKRSAGLGFAEGARELAETGASCRGRPDYDRCRLNRYNSGVRYARHGWAGNYWLRVLCFAEAARQGKGGGGCLQIRSRDQIAAAMGAGQRRAGISAPDDARIRAAAAGGAGSRGGLALR